MFKFLRRLCADEDGPTAVEYAVMLALIVVICIGSVKAMARAAGDSFNGSADAIADAMGP
jgi:pilus assembly protein Flp/PilA